LNNYDLNIYVEIRKGELDFADREQFFLDSIFCDTEYMLLYSDFYSEEFYLEEGLL